MEVFCAPAGGCCCNTSTTSSTSRSHAVSSHAWASSLAAQYFSNQSTSTIPNKCTLCPCRWLLLHNYTLSVPEAYSQINRPALKQESEGAIADNSTTSAGSIENFMYYIQKGMPQPCHRQANHTCAQLSPE